MADSRRAGYISRLEKEQATVKAMMFLFGVADPRVAKEEAKKFDEKVEQAIFEEDKNG